MNRDTLPWPKTGLLSNTWAQMSQGDTGADRVRELTGKGHLGGEQQDKGTHENLLCHLAHSLGLYGDGISFQVVSGQSF